MVPRTKVNYGFWEVLRALVLREQGTDYREPTRNFLRQYLGCENILLTASGRAALYSLLRSIEKPVVLIPGYTCKAVSEAIRLAGRTVDFVEVENGGFNMSAKALAEKATKDCVVIATHQFGIPCDIEAVQRVCEETGATLVEDVAAALGTHIRGRAAGTFGEAAFFSFDSTKLINVPLKGGFLMVKDQGLFERIREDHRASTVAMPLAEKGRILLMAAILVLLRNHWLYRLFHLFTFGIRNRFTTDTPELNLVLDHFYTYKLANWQAFFASDQLAHMKKTIGTLRARYAQYRDSLKDCRTFDLPPEDTCDEWACVRFPIRTKGDKIAFYQQCVKRGIDLAFSFTFIDCPTTLPNSRSLASSVLDLPYFAGLTDAEAETVISVLKEVDRGE